MTIVACWPTTTRYGVNFQVYSREIPLYEKATNFVSRHFEARRLTDEITAGATSDAARLEQIFSWVGENIRPQPPEFPVFDDHVWNIIVRRYGVPDQRSEVFTLLASYACCPATVVGLNAAPRKRILLAVVELDGAPRVFDVVHRRIFRNEAGNFASIGDLARNPNLVAAVADGLRPHDLPYQQYFAAIADVRPVFVRMDLQKPLQRLRIEAVRLARGVW